MAGLTAAIKTARAELARARVSIRVVHECAVSENPLFAQMVFDHIEAITLLLNQYVTLQQLSQEYELSMKPAGGAQ